jgi:hypothetical protein
MSKTQAEIDAEFNLWFAKSFDAHVAQHMARIDRHLHEIDKTFNAIADVFDKIDRSIDAQRADIGALAKAIGGKKDADGKMMTLRRLDDVVERLRAEMREETAAKFKAMRALIRKDMTQGDAASNGNITALVRKS